MSLTGKNIALFVADIYEDNEFWYPYYRMQEEGAEVTVIGPKKDTTYASKHGNPVTPDAAITDVTPGDFAAVIIPGGYSPDHMRRTPEMAEFVKKMHEAGKVVAAICHAGWMLVSAGILKGKKVTSFYSIKDDLLNAGAEWVDEAVVNDSNIITSRTPDDLPRYCREIIKTLQ